LICLVIIKKIVYLNSYPFFIQIFCKITKADFDEYYVKDLNEYNTTIQTLLDDNKEVYFRGVNQARHNLAPSISRLDQSRLTLETEIRLFKAFRRRIAMYKTETFREYTSASTQFDLETLAIAQHHSLKTRLLDWSTNPLASLYFACEQPNAPNPDDYCCIWVLIAPTDEERRKKFFEFGERVFKTERELFKHDETFMYVPNIVNSRIRNQAGLFSVHHLDGNKHLPLDENAEFFPHKFKEITHSTSDHWNLIRILINRKLYGDNILNNLRKFDIHEETIYPSLEKAGARLNYDFNAGLVL
jgi:hypothetical protein